MNLSVKKKFTNRNSNEKQRERKLFMANYNKYEITLRPNDHPSSQFSPHTPSFSLDFSIFLPNGIIGKQNLSHSGSVFGHDD